MVEAKIPYVNGSILETRKYQIDIAKACLGKNSLVVIPTGLGKTIIAVLLVGKMLEISPPYSKVIVLAPTRPLIDQHYKSFLKFLDLSEDQYTILTGKIVPNKRTELFNQHKMLFFTPQTLRNDIVSERYELDDTCLIIFDEAHHASGDYPYTMIADEYIDQNPDGVILALTASPGSSKKKITELCQTLHIPPENIHTRTRKDSDVKNYLKPMDVFKIGVDMNDLMAKIYLALHLVLEECLNYLIQMKFLPTYETKNGKLYEVVMRKDLLSLDKNLTSIIVEDRPEKSMAYRAKMVNAQALILYYMLELVEQQGLDILLNYMERLNKEAKNPKCGKGKKNLVVHSRIRNVYLELKKNEEFNPTNLIHPKFNVLKKVLLKEIKHNPKSRILVFVKLRDSVRSITENLEEIKEIKPARFVGQSNKSKGEKGLTQKQQIEILEEFKKGTYNTLISTNVGEEGLDIAECDLVVFFDVVASETRMIQRKGRTARHRKGKVVIIYTFKTRDEVYLSIALSKLRRMNINLKSPKELRAFYENELRNEKSTEEINKSSNKNNNTEEILNNQEDLLFSDVSHPISKTPRKKQYDLRKYVYGVEKKKVEELLETQVFVKISKNLDMKYGLKNRLTKENILFRVDDSDNLCVLHDEVVINIYSPMLFEKEKCFNQYKRLEKDFKLIIFVFDFINYSYIEKFEGEKKLLKRKIQEFSKEKNIQVILMETVEELFFIVKSIYEHNQKKHKKKNE